MSAPIQFTVWGLAMPQGSKSARVVGRGASARAIMTEGFGDGPARRKGWRSAVSDAARRTQEQARCGLFDGALTVTVCFYLPRPKSAPKRVLRPATKPDASKLVRAVEDSLTGILIADDARIVDLRVEKWFAANGLAPCAVVRIESTALGAVPSLRPAQLVEVAS